MDYNKVIKDLRTIRDSTAEATLKSVVKGAIQLIEEQRRKISDVAVLLGAVHARIKERDTDQDPE